MAGGRRTNARTVSPAVPALALAAHNYGICESCLVCRVESVSQSDAMRCAAIGCRGIGCRSDRSMVQCVALRGGRLGVRVGERALIGGNATRGPRDLLTRD